MQRRMDYGVRGAENISTSFLGAQSRLLCAVNCCCTPGVARMIRGEELAEGQRRKLDP